MWLWRDGEKIGGCSFGGVRVAEAYGGLMAARLADIEPGATWAVVPKKQMRVTAEIAKAQVVQVQGCVDAGKMEFGEKRRAKPAMCKE